MTIFNSWWWKTKYEKWLMKFVWALPKKIAYWSTIRVGAHATTGQWGNTIVPELTLMDALKRWEQK
jgi:hypothetical protein